MVHEAHHESPAKAAGLLLIGVTGGLGLDICAKALLETYPLAQFVFVRSLIAVTIFLLLSGRFGGLQSLRTRAWRWHLLRTLLATGAMFGFFYGLSKMPLVTTLTLGFTAPLMVTALSVPFLGEHVGWRRWSAVMIGFAGVLVVLRPDVSGFTFHALAVLFGAFCYACLAITARKLSSTENIFSLSLYVTAGPMLVSAFVTIKTPWLAPDATGWSLFILAGACSVIAWIGIIGGYGRASPALLAPLEYTALVGGAIAGYFLWSEIPDRWVIVGSVIIVASGLFVVYREVGAVMSSRYMRAVTAAGVAAIARRLTPQRARPSKNDSD